jgi:exopolysaccharide biosynthesis polyprenyl glycosylphosphotransferase
MTNFRRQFLDRILVWLDLVIVAISFCITSAFVWHLTAFHSFASFISLRVSVSNIVLLAVLFGAWHLIFAALGLYGSKRLGDRKQEVFDVLRANSAATTVLGFVGATLRLHMITPSFLFEFWAISAFNLIFCRILLRTLLFMLRSKGHNVHHLVIVGANRRAIEFVRLIEERPEMGYHLIGFVDEEWSGTQALKDTGMPVVSDLDGFACFLREHVVDEVAIALPVKSFYAQAARIVVDCREQGVIVRVLSDIFDFEPKRAGDTRVQEMAVATIGQGVMDGWPFVFKRVLDIAVSSALLVLFAPLFLVVAIFVRRDSTGPAFFVQDRIGLNKRRFRMYKFRTMVEGAEKRQAALELLNEADGPVFKIKNDPRVTRVGRVLRKTSIDELPQLLNVLRGDMSLVGPRPLDLRDYRGLDEDWLRRRFSVRPGITCLWQVNGRSALPFRQWMQLDLHYIDHWSLWLDMKLIAKTIPAVFKGVGAA